MKITVLTLFPEILEGFFKSSIFARAESRGLVESRIINFRSFTTDSYNKADDDPFGGGAGMVLKPEPLFRALDSIDAGSKRVIYATPSGKPLTQNYSLRLSQESELVFIAGHYEGIDQRVIDKYVTDEICIGDYVVSSGEIATLVIIDSVYRLVDGVIKKESLCEESFSDGLLEYPQYTRPAVYDGMSVPEVLLSGNHAEIRKWRHAKKLEKTFLNRKDLLAEYPLTEDDRKMIEEWFF